MRDLPAEALDYRHQLRKLLHGVILQAIADQVWVRQDDGTSCRYDPLVWKAWLKQRCGIQGSSEDLDDWEFRVFIWLVESFAATEMGVTFIERGVRHEHAA